MEITAYGISSKMNNSMNEPMNQWMNEPMNEWTNEWMIKNLFESAFHKFNYLLSIIGSWYSLYNEHNHIMI